MLRAKYEIGDGGPLVFKAKQQSSQIWKGLVWGSELLHMGLRWHINNGTKALLTKDRWLDDVLLLQRCVQQVGKEEASITINKYCEEGRCWGWDPFSHYLSSSVPL